MVRRVEAIGTVVIGAGAAGLATGRALAERGLPFVVLEREAAVAASWRSRYDRLHLHTAKRYSELPGMRYPAEVPTYPSRLQVVDYLTAYADRFGIRPRFDCDVQRLEPTAKGWRTRTSQGDFHSDNVVVATGFNAVPVSPRWPGMDDYRGELLHSAVYRRPDRWAGKRVLVVGSGNSGAEIALDLVEQGSQVDLCVRGKLHVLKRDTLGLPNPVPSILLGKLPMPVADAIARTTLRLTMGNLRRWGIETPEVGPFRAIAESARIPLVDVGTVDRIKKGDITVRKGIDRFDREGVVFVDGERQPYAAIVLATGFRTGLERFLVGAEDLLDSRGRRRAPDVEVRRGLFLIGFVQPATGLLREIGREATRVAEGIAAKRAAA
jgi:indole-3-pyruvate monooxygenase